MDLKNCLNRYYYNMTVNEIRTIFKVSGEMVSHNSMMYLDIISFQENCTVSTLSQTLQISKPAVTKKVNELVAQGLVIKTQSKDDKRVYYLTASKDFMEDNVLYDRIFDRALNNVKGKYSEEQLDLFCRILDTFSDEYIKRG